MELLDSPIRPYAWGSRYAIAAVQGREIPTGGPEAELWVGAHPGAPSRLVSDGRSLADAVAADPAGLLGPAERFGRLPFLMKLLAAEQPLSLQAHPDADQARAGFDAEQAAGVPLDAPHRNYADPYHKPEMLVALTDFDVLCGFREPAVSAHVLDRLGVADLEPVVAALRSATGPATAGALRTAVTHLLTLPDDRRAAVVGEAVAAATKLRSRWSEVRSRWPEVRSRWPEVPEEWWRSAGRGELAGSCRRTRRRGRTRWRRSSASGTRVMPGCWSRCCSTTGGCDPARRSSRPPATCTCTCAASVWRSWRPATTCCAAASPPSASTSPSC
jgi:hypothetical protein